MSLRILAALFGAALMACVPMAEALAINDPIPGVDIIVKKNPSGIVVSSFQTNGQGEFTIKDLEPGQYTIELVGKSLIAATAVSKADTRTKTMGTPAPAAPSTSRTGTAVAVGDVNGDGAIIAILIGLLLPANTMAPGGTTHRDKASAKGIQTTLTVSGAAGSKHSYKGRVTAEK